MVTFCKTRTISTWYVTSSVVPGVGKVVGASVKGGVGKVVQSQMPSKATLDCKLVHSTGDNTPCAASACHVAHVLS